MTQTTVIREGDTGHNYVETTIGETPNSVELSTNAKGAAQLTVKLYYATPRDMRVAVADELATIIEQVKAALADAGIPLAGQTIGQATGQTGTATGEGK